MSMKKTISKSNNENRQGKRSYWTTIGVLAFAIVLVFAATYGVILITENMAHSSAEKLVSNVVDRIDGKILEVETDTRNEAGIIRGQLDNPDALEKMIYDFVEQHDLIYGSTIAFEPNAFADKGYSFAPYSWRENGKVYSRQLGEETDFYQEEWYAETKSSLEEYWCEPYFDEGGAKIMMCTFSVPLLDENGQLIAVLTADIGLDDLEGYIKTINPYRDSYILLNSQKGTVLVGNEAEALTISDHIIIKGITDIGWTVELSMSFTSLLRGDTGMFVILCAVLFITVILVYFINLLIVKSQQRASEKYQKVIAEQAAFTKFFLEPYMSAYYVGLDNLSFQIYKRTSRLEEDYPINTNYLESIEAYIHNEVREESREEFLKLVQPEKMKEILASRPEFSYYFQTTPKHGSKYIKFQALRGADENHAAFGFADITEETLAQQEQKQKLEDALDMAQAANKAKTDFLFSMSHDIRTPMNAITGFTNMSIKHIDEKEKVLDYLDKTQKAGTMLLSLINSVLEVSRIEAGNVGIEEQPGDIMSSFNAIEGTLHEMAKTKDIDLSFEFANIEDRLIYADFGRCTRIFVNVISNAIKYTPEGGTVKALCEQIGRNENGCGLYKFTVSDNGIGMSEEFQKHIYDQFARENTTTVSGVQGSGLGMSVVKSFVDIMGGTIELKSKQGEGTVLTIILPLRLQTSENKNEDVDENGVAFAVSAGSGIQLDFTGKNVLLVEDNELNREIAVDILGEEGFVVEEAEDGSVAVEMLREKGPDYYDAILMDIQMPIMNGFEATKAIRAMYPDVHIPIIALSANAFEEDKKASVEAGMDDHVPKPVDIGLLKETLAKYI